MPADALDTVAAVWFAAINVVTFLTFGLDKWRAGRAGRRRVPESTLVGIAALGGWPGGLIGMKLFHHKTAKRSFQFKFALSLIPFFGLIWLWLQLR
jgi:uncharacterized membrane protein YsdA (DUF1294 family)